MGPGTPPGLLPGVAVRLAVLRADFLRLQSLLRLFRLIRCGVGHAISVERQRLVDQLGFGRIHQLLLLLGQLLELLVRLAAFAAGLASSFFPGRFIGPAVPHGRVSLGGVACEPQEPVVERAQEALLDARLPGVTVATLVATGLHPLGDGVTVGGGGSSPLPGSDRVLPSL